MIKSIKHYLISVFLFYCLTTIVLYILLSQYIPHEGLIIIQILLSISYFLILFINFNKYKPHPYLIKFKEKKMNLLPLYIFIYQITLSLLLRELFLSVYDHPFGFNPADSLRYHDLAIKSRYLSFSELFHFLKNQNLNIDDYGFPIIQYAIYSVVNTEHGALILSLFTNSLAITISAIVFLKLSEKLLPQKIAYLGAIILGFSPFAVFASVSNLKENYLILFVILAFYYLYKFLQKPGFLKILLFGIFTAIVFLFRYSVAYMLIICFATGIIASLKNIRKLIPLLAVIIVICCILFIDSIFALITTDVNIGYWLEVKLDRVDSHMVGIIVNLISTTVGPLPNFLLDADSNQSMLMYNSFVLLKIFISYFYLIGIWLIIKNKEYKLYPILTFVFLHSIMIFVTFFSMHLRFQWPQIPAFLIISGYGFYNFNKEGHRSKYSKIYVLVSVMLIIVFNFRFA